MDFSFPRVPKRVEERLLPLSRSGRGSDGFGCRKRSFFTVISGARYLGADEVGMGIVVVRLNQRPLPIFLEEM
jgi:hypothetical protein